DVYSLGATLYYLLTGRPPFEGEVDDVLRAVQRGAFAPPSQPGRQIDRSLEAVCLKAMSLDPDDRYPSPKSLAEDVARWLADEPVLARREPRSERLARWMRHHRSWTQAGAAALVAVAAVSIAAALVVDRARWREARARRAESAARAEASGQRDRA